MGCLGLESLSKGFWAFGPYGWFLTVVRFTSLSREACWMGCDFLDEFGVCSEFITGMA